jgi:hypothetical protein
MSNYESGGNRWTAIYAANGIHGTENFTYTKLPWELVRFNVDSNPSATPVIVPDGEDSGLGGAGTAATPVKEPRRIYEKIWIVDAIPYREKTSFGEPI